MTDDAIEIGKLLVGLTGALAWPTLVAIAVVYFRKPIRAVVEGLPRKFSEAKKLSIGSLSLEIEAKAREVGQPELAAQVGSLSAGAVQQLLRTPRTGDMILVSTGNYLNKREYGLPHQDVLDSLQELEAKGFLKLKMPLLPYVQGVRRLPSSNADRTVSERDWHLSPYDADSAEDKRIREQGYSLTDRGRQAVDTIVKAVAEQLSREST